MTKKFLFSLLCCCFALGSVFANDTGDINDPLIVRTSATESGIDLVLANLQGVTTTVELQSLDTKKMMLDEQVRNHNGFSYDLQLDKLDQGRYLLKVTKGKVVRQQVILISDAGIFLSQIK